MMPTQTLSVEHEELMARADELEAPISELPTGNPQAPCALAMAIAAADQLGLSADNMRLYLGVGQREWGRLAESLRNAAQAYEEVDDDAAAALEADRTSVSAATCRVTNDDLALVTLGRTPMARAAFEPWPYREVSQAAIDISRPDQGVSLDRFAAEWTSYQRSLVEAAYRFRPFQYWDGDATAAVEANFDQQRSWLYQMADLGGTMATQARNVASAHRWAVSGHPTTDQIQFLDEQWHYYQSNYAGTWVWEDHRLRLLAEYAEYQTLSEEVLAEYAMRAGLPLPPIQPPKPPTAYHIPPPPELEAYDTYDAEPISDDWPALDEELPDPTGMPTVSWAGTAPMPDDAALTDALVGAPGLPAGAAGLKPASFGGVGSGLPSMPLQPPIDPGSVPPAAAARGAGLPGLPPGAGAAMGSGGMGMAPMGAPGAQGQGQDDKGKRSQEDELLYIEQRPWTEAVIGLRRARETVGH